MRLLICLLACLAQPAWSWTLDNDHSRLAFVSIKAGDIGEVHHFRQLSGSIEDGKATLTIELASIDTLIPIRDERMQTMLFETGLFPRATVTVNLDPEVLESESVQSATVTGELTIREQTLSLNADVTATVSGDSLLVATNKPILVSARAVGLSEGVEKLREVAGLPAISDAVPVTFVLRFKR